MPEVKAIKRVTSKARQRRKGPVRITRISSKNQTTLPVAVLERAGLTAGMRCAWRQWGRVGYY